MFGEHSFQLKRIPGAENYKLAAAPRSTKGPSTCRRFCRISRPDGAPKISKIPLLSLKFLFSKAEADQRLFNFFKSVGFDV